MQILDPSTSERVSVSAENMRSVLTAVPSGCSISFTFVNKETEGFLSRANAFPLMGDALDSYREELNNLFKLKQGPKGTKIQKSRFVTIKVDKEAHGKVDFFAMHSALNSVFKSFGVTLADLEGMPRLKAIKDIMNLDNSSPKSDVSWESLTKLGLTPKDFIMPSGADFTQTSTFQLGASSACVSWVNFLGNSLDFESLSDLIDSDNKQVVTVNLEPISTETLRKKGDKSKSCRQVYDKLVSSDESLFVVTVLVLTVAKDELTLMSNLESQRDILRQMNCTLNPLFYQQEQGFYDCCLLGTAGVSTRFAYVSSDVGRMISMSFKPSVKHSGVPYGIDYLTNTPVLVPRNQNAVISGSVGKSGLYAIQREIFMQMLTARRNMFVIDSSGLMDNFITMQKGSVLRLDDFKVDPMSNLESPISHSSLLMSAICDSVNAGTYSLTDRQINELKMVCITLEKSGGLSLASFLEAIREVQELREVSIYADLRILPLLDHFTSEQLTSMEFPNATFVKLDSLPINYKGMELLVWLSYLATVCTKNKQYASNLSFVIVEPALLFSQKTVFDYFKEVVHILTSLGVSITLFSADHSSFYAPEISSYISQFAPLKVLVGSGIPQSALSSLSKGDYNFIAQSSELRSVVISNGVTSLVSDVVTKSSSIYKMCDVM